MSLLPVTKSILAQVEQLTGKPVYLEENASLPAFANLTIARGDAPVHLLRYKPMGANPPDYYITFQCGFVIRLYQTSAEKRFDLAVSEDGTRKMDELLADPAFSPQVRGMGGQLIDGLLVQLRSMPIGLRVDAWIAGTFPELKDLQRAGAEVQLEQNSRAIGLGSKKMFPAKVYKGNMSMNAAFAIFWGRMWNDAKITLPYKATGFLDAGQRLIKIFDSVNSEPTRDTELIDNWAFELGVKGWYRWVPHHAGKPS